MSDPELEAIRQKRMQELMAQQGGGGGAGGGVRDGLCVWCVCGGGRKYAML